MPRPQLPWPTRRSLAGRLRLRPQMHGTRSIQAAEKAGTNQHQCQAASHMATSQAANQAARAARHTAGTHRAAAVLATYGVMAASQAAGTQKVGETLAAKINRPELPGILYRT